MPILWANRGVWCPDEAAALLDTKTRHQKLIFHLGQRSIEWRLAHGTLDIGACQEVKGQYIGVSKVTTLAMHHWRMTRPPGPPYFPTVALEVASYANACNLWPPAMRQYQNAIRVLPMFVTFDLQICANVQTPYANCQCILRWPWRSRHAPMMHRQCCDLWHANVLTFDLLASANV